MVNGMAGWMSFLNHCVFLSVCLSVYYLLLDFVTIPSLVVYNGRFTVMQTDNTLR